MHLLNGQSILLDWFKHNSGSAHNLSKIRVICQNISLIEAIENDRYYLYRYFFPLVRIGLIEFVGNDNYVLSSPVLYIKEKAIIAINFSETKIHKLKNLIKAQYLNDLVIYYDYKNKNEIESTLEIECIDLKAENILISVSNLQKIIDTFESLDLQPDSGFQKYNSNGWSSSFNHNEAGCYKATENIASKRYLMTSLGKWKEIPNRNINPDAFNLAVCYSKVESKQDIGVEYDKQKMELKIFDIHFPIIIERLLWIFYINRLGDVFVDANNHLLFKNFPSDTFKQLNRFFLNKIQIL